MEDQLPPPPPLEYGNPTPPPRPREPFAKPYLSGLGVGSAVSLILWGFGWTALDKVGSVGFGLLLAVPVAKLVVGIVLCATRRSVGFGAGLITSIAVGALIFFGSCLAHLNH